MNVAEWLAWFLDTLHRAVHQALHAFNAVQTKARFWQRWIPMALNARQVRLRNTLLYSFEGKRTRRKWAAIAQCTPDMALRDINNLLARGVLRRLDAGGRGARYALNDLPG